MNHRNLKLYFSIALLLLCALVLVDSGDAQKTNARWNPDIPKLCDILGMSVGTDPDLTLKTKRGTGYYKVPSLKGVWYRGSIRAQRIGCHA